MLMPAADRVLVSSIERGNAGVELVVRDVTRDGRAGGPVAVAPSTSDRSSGFARMALAGKRVVLAWTEIGRGAPPRVRAASAVLK